MKLAQVILAAVLVVTLSAAGSAWAAEEKPDAAPPAEEIVTVTTEGLGAIVGGDVAAAREAAIQQALALAVRQRMGTELQAQRVVQNTVLIYDRVETKAKGLVHKFEVKQEKRFAQTYWVEVDAQFVKDVIRARGLDKLQVAIAADETYQDSDETRSSNVIRSALGTDLLEMGLRIVPLNQKGSGDEAATLKAALAADADLLVTVTAASKRKDDFGGLKLHEAEIELRVTKPVSGEVIAAKTFTAKSPKRSDNDADAARSALTAVREELQKYFADRVIAATEGLVECRMFLQNVEGRHVTDQLIKSLVKRNGVHKVELKQLEDEERLAVLMIRCDLKAKDHLAEDLEHVDGVAMKVEQQSAGWIRAVVVE